MAFTKPQVKIVGLNKFSRALKDYEGAIEDLKEAHKQSAQLVADTARPNVPVRSGRLAGDMRVTGTKRGGRVAQGRKSIPYAGPVHFGWPNRPDPSKGWRGGPIRPNPWIYDALDRRRGEVEDAFVRYLEQAKRRYDL